jgi:hypothetical protein
MSGLPDIGILRAQIGYSRFGWQASRTIGAAPSFETRPLDAPQDEDGVGSTQNSSVYSAAACGRPSWIARHTRSAVAGISM